MASPRLISKLRHTVTRWIVRPIGLVGPWCFAALAMSIAASWLFQKPFTGFSCYYDRPPSREFDAISFSIRASYLVDFDGLNFSATSYVSVPWFRPEDLPPGPARDELLRSTPGETEYSAQFWKVQSKPPRQAWDVPKNCQGFSYERPNYSTLVIYTHGAIDAQEGHSHYTAPKQPWPTDIVREWWELETRFRLPTWLAILLLMIWPTVRVTRSVRRRKRAKTGFCVECGYNLRGSLEAGRCPECGTAIDLGGRLAGKSAASTRETSSSAT